MCIGFFSSFRRACWIFLWLFLCTVRSFKTTSCAAACDNLKNTGWGWGWGVVMQHVKPTVCIEGQNRGPANLKRRGMPFLYIIVPAPDWMRWTAIKKCEVEGFRSSLLHISSRQYEMLLRRRSQDCIPHVLCQGDFIVFFCPTLLWPYPVSC